MSKLNFGFKNEAMSSEDKKAIKEQKYIKREEKRRLSKKEKEAELNELLSRNEMHMASEIKNFVSSVLSSSDLEVNGTTAVYFVDPNGFRVELFKGYRQSIMDNKVFLPAGKSFDLNEYQEIADILKQNKDIIVEEVNENGVFGSVPKFSKDTYASYSLGINPEDDKEQREKVLDYLNKKNNPGNTIEEDKTRIARLKESIYSLFNKNNG